MKIKEHRVRFDLSGKHLRRARHLFVLFFGKGKIETTIDLNVVATAMYDHNFYAKSLSKKSALRTIRYSILRKLWKMDGGTPTPYPNPMDWYRWTQGKGWMCYTWEQKVA